MPSVYDVLRTRHQQRFVGRTHELRDIAEWLRTPSPPTRVVVVTGPPGIGKTEFFVTVQDLAAEHGVRRLWIDGRLAPLNPSGLAAHLTSLVEATWRIRGWEDLDHRAVVLLDNYETLVHLDDWLRRYLLDWLPANGVLWMMAARGAPLSGWSRDLIWSDRVRSVALEPLSPEEVDEFLARRDARHVAPELVRKAHGLPLALQILCDRATANERAGVDWVGREVADSIWSAVADPDVRRTLMLLSTIHRADEELVEAVVGRPPLQLADALESIAVVRSDPRGLSIHDAYRSWMRADAQNRWPDEFARIQTLAAQNLTGRLSRRRGPDQQVLAGSLLTLVREMLPHDDHYADLTADFDQPPEPPRPEDRPYLHRFSAAWARPPIPLRDPAALRRLLDAWLDTVPALVRVYRRPDGRPIAFFAPLLLSDATNSIIERYVGPVADWLDEDPAALAQPFEQADTFFGGLLGVDPEDPVVRVQLVGLVIRDGLSLLAGGMRSLLLVGNPYLIAMLLRIGYKVRQPARPTPDDWQFYELDLRERDFVEWILDVTGGVLPRPDAAINPRDLRRALDHLREPKVLELSPVAKLKGWSGTQLQQHLVELLTTSSPPLPLGLEDQALLAEVYLPPGRPPEQIAITRHLSRATLYRRVSRALAALASVLAHF